MTVTSTNQIKTPLAASPSRESAATASYTMLDGTRQRPGVLEGDNTKNLGRAPALVRYSSARLFKGGLIVFAVHQ